MSSLYVVFGAGQIGLPLASRLLAAGHRVRQVSRSGTAAPGAEAYVADLSDPEQAAAAAAGAEAVVMATNPTYTQWHTHLLPLHRGALAGVKEAGARYVVLDCLYGYGVPDGPLRADSPMQPCSRKGALRKELHELYFGPEAAGVQVAVARGADFAGPDVAEALLTGAILRGFARGGRAFVPGDGDLPRGYSFGPDVVAGLAALAQDPDAAGVWMLPTTNTTTNELLATLAERAGVPGKTLPLPTWAIRAAGWVVPMARELAEMMYQWEVPYTVDCGPMEERYGLRAATCEEIADAVLASLPAAARAA